MDISIERNILEANDCIAGEMREIFAKNKVLVLNLISSPGSGKTSLLEKTLSDLRNEFKMGVIEGDCQTDNDAKRVAATGAKAVQINTDGGCHLDSKMIKNVISCFDLPELDILFIENVGNLVCPVEFDCGEDAKIALLSAAEGDDKPEKYPRLFQLAHAMVINKVDLLDYVDFDVAKASKFGKALNNNIEIFEVSCRTCQGLQTWYAWLRKQVAFKQQ